MAHFPATFLQILFRHKQHCLYWEVQLHSFINHLINFFQYNYYALNLELLLNCYSPYLFQVFI